MNNKYRYNRISNIITDNKIDDIGIITIDKDRLVVRYNQID